jgi:hypothetical protein
MGSSQSEHEEHTSRPVDEDTKELTPAEREELEREDRERGRTKGPGEAPNVDLPPARGTSDDRS